MDILQRKLLKIGTPCFFVASSVEEPFIYLRFAGIISDKDNIEDNTIYRIRIVKVLEEYTYINKFLNRVRFRVKNQKDGKFIDKYFYTYDLDKNNFDFEFAERFKNYHIDISSLFVFDNIPELERELSTINKHINDKLVNTLKWVGKRINEQ